MPPQEPLEPGQMRYRPYIGLDTGETLCGKVSTPRTSAEYQSDQRVITQCLINKNDVFWFDQDNGLLCVPVRRIEFVQLKVVEGA